MGILSWLKRKKHKPTQVPQPVQPNGGSMPAKALLVGINSYPGYPLSGCVNDVANVANLLMQNYGFSQDQICILRDRDATTANILAKLEWLVSVNPGDRVLFWYSGHGAQYATGGTGEPDGLSELMCPVDFDWSPQHMIIDKQLVQIFSRIPQGVVFNWGSDSCHSGDLDRDLPPVSTDGLFGPLRKLWNMVFGPKVVQNKSKSYPAPDHVTTSVNLARAMNHAPKGMVNGILDVGFVSGCQSNQTSADTNIGGQACGAMTWYFLKNLRTMAGSSLSDVVAATSRDLAANGYSQRPQAEGARKDKPFLLA